MGKAITPAPLQALLRYLKIDPSTNAYDSLGDIYMLAGTYDKAEEMKVKAAEKDSSLYFVKRSLVFPGTFCETQPRGAAEAQPDARRGYRRSGQGALPRRFSVLSLPDG